MPVPNELSQGGVVSGWGLAIPRNSLVRSSTRERRKGFRLGGEAPSTLFTPATHK